MSCQHGNHADACDLCDELNDSYKAGLAEGLSQQALRDAINSVLANRASLHAERAMVSGLARVLVDTIDNECEHVTSDAVWAAKERLQRQLAAAPSQPEDAA